MGRDSLPAHRTQAAGKHSAFDSLPLPCRAWLLDKGMRRWPIYRGVKVLYGNIGQPQSPRQEVEPLTFYLGPRVGDETIGETYEI